MISSLLLNVLVCIKLISSGNLPSPVIGAYFPNWAQYRSSPATFTPTQLSPIIDTLNVIWYGFAYFCPNSSMIQPYWVTDLELCEGKEAFDVIPVEPKDTTFYQEIIDYKSQNSELKVIISIGGWNFPSNFFSQMVSSKTSRTAFITSAKAFMTEYGFDGIDIDWEYPKSPARTDEVKISCTDFDETQDIGGSSDDGVNLVSLVSEMRSTFGDDTIITIASQADMTKAQDEDIKGLFDYIDMFNLMTYDYTVSDITDSPLTAPNEPLYSPDMSSLSNDSVSSTINGYLANDIPASQLSVGVAYYGHSWYVPSLGSDSSAWCKYGLSAKIQGDCCGSFAQTYGAKYGQYSQLCGTYMYSEIQSAGFETCFDNATMSNIGYAISPTDGYTAEGVWISYQDIETVDSIVEFAKSKNLAGIFAFDISMDSMSGSTFTFELTKQMATFSTA